MNKFRIELYSKIQQEGGKYYVPIGVLSGFGEGIARFELPSAINYQNTDPIILPRGTIHGKSNELFYLYRNHIVMVTNGNMPQEELVLRVKHFVLEKENEFIRIKKEIQAYENLGEISTARREQLPDSVRLFVWQRDQGKCVKCGSNEKLEFDHIIPVIKGGSNTERNVQLLCENCNRSKGSTI